MGRGMRTQYKSKLDETVCRSGHSISEICQSTGVERHMLRNLRDNPINRRTKMLLDVCDYLGISIYDLL